MKKTVGIACIALGLASCSTPNYLPCPAYSSNTEGQEGLVLSAHGQENDYYHELEQDKINYQQIDCCNCDEID